MNKQLLCILFCALLLSALAFSVAAQGTQCNLDYTAVYTALENSSAAQANGDMAGALTYLSEAFTLLERIKTTCDNSLNWCFPGQPWGDGRCNGPDLSQEQIDWFWTCGTYWAEYERGLLEVVPDWCGFDSDGDGYTDDADQCPYQGGHVDNTGCPTCDTSLDADCDGTPDSFDQCPNDPGKAAPGACGCGIPDTDGNGDGTPDCNDQCPADPNKVAPGICGCGTPDTDTDGDNTPDCFDQCDNDPNKTAPGVCNCGFADDDSDGDGAYDCIELCDTDPNKTAPGTCGCGRIEDVGDGDGDGRVNCHDACPMPDDDVHVGELCWWGLNPPYDCVVRTDAQDQDNDGCFDYAMHGPASGCNANTPSCH